MDINFWEMIARTTGSFFAILFLARIIGKKQLSQLTFFHYVTGITFGSIASEICSTGRDAFLGRSHLTLLVGYINCCR